MKHESISSAGPDAPTSCEELVCSYGATCIEVNDQAHCECPSPDCDEKNKTKVGLPHHLLGGKNLQFNLQICNMTCEQKDMFQRPTGS